MEHEEHKIRMKILAVQHETEVLNRSLAKKKLEEFESRNNCMSS